MYSLSVEYLVSKKLTFDIQENDYCKYYRLLMTFLDKGDYNSVMRANQETVKNISNADQCVTLSILECVAFHKELIPEMSLKFKKPTIFFIDFVKLSRD